MKYGWPRRSGTDGICDVAAIIAEHRRRGAFAVTPVDFIPTPARQAQQSPASLPPTLGGPTRPRRHTRRRRRRLGRLCRHHRRRGRRAGVATRADGDNNPPRLPPTRPRPRRPRVAARRCSTVASDSARGGAARARASGEIALAHISPAPARGGCTLIQSALSIGGEPALMAPAGEAAREAKSVSPITAVAVVASPSQPLPHPPLQGSIRGGSGRGCGGGGGGDGGYDLAVTIVAAVAAPLTMRMWPSRLLFLADREQLVRTAGGGDGCRDRCGRRPPTSPSRQPVSRRRRRLLSWSPPATLRNEVTNTAQPLEERPPRGRQSIRGLPRPRQARRVHQARHKTEKDVAVVWWARKIKRRAQVPSGVTAATLAADTTVDATTAVATTAHPAPTAVVGGAITMRNQNRQRTRSCNLICAQFS